MAAIANANFSAAEQLAGFQRCQGCKGKNWSYSLAWRKLGKGLAMFLLIPLLGWAMLVFVAMLLLLSYNCTIFGFVLYNVPIGYTSNFHWKIRIIAEFLVHFSFPWLVWPNPQLMYLHFGQYVLRLGLILFTIATCIYPWPNQPVPFPASSYLKPSGSAYNSFWRSNLSGSVTSLINSSATHSFI